MERIRSPLLAILCITLFVDVLAVDLAWILGWDIDVLHGMALGFGLCTMLARRHSPVCGMVSAAAALGTMLAAGVLTTYPMSPGTREPYRKARIEGSVGSVRTDGRFVMEGTVDGQHLPPMEDSRIHVRVVDSIEGIAEGQRVVVYGSVRRRAMTAWGPVAWECWCRARDVDVRGDPGPLQVAVGRSRGALRHHIEGNYTPSSGPMILALLTGDQSGIPKEERRWHAAAGTAHMFSVSGSHVTLMLGIISTLFAWVALPWIRTIICLTAIAWFVLVTGGEAPGIRAALCGGLGIVGRLLERDRDDVTILSATALVMIVMDPVLPWNISFQLSMAAALGILFLTPAWEGCLRRCIVVRRSWHGTAIATWSVGMAASAAISIPSAMIFGATSLVSPLANIPVVPLMSGAMTMALCGVVVDLVGLPFHTAFIACAETMLHLANVIARWMSMAQPDHYSSIAVAVVFVVTTWWIPRCSTWLHLVTRGTVAAVVMTLVCLM